MIPNKMYDIMKWVVMIVIPALLTCFTTIAGLVGMPTSTIALVVGIVSAITTCAGTILGISSAAYNKP